MKVAIAHDFLNVLGGAERVTLALSEIFPDAPIYTLFYNKRNLDNIFGDKEIITSSLQKKAELLGFRHKYLFPLMAKAVEEFDFRDFDVVVSSQSAWMKGIITKPETIHITYCHTPTRFLWMETDSYLKQQGIGSFKRWLVSRMISKIRLWDRLAADRVDYWLTNSNLTKERIGKYYRKEATVIYPAVDTERFKLSKNKKDYFLIVSRLSRYKMVDVAVDAFNDLGLPLIIIGDGQQRKELAQKAKPNVKILGYKSDEEIIKYYQEARGFIFPTFYEDFGLTPVEAMSCGTPVIAAKDSGARESVKEGITGEFFDKPIKESLIKAVKRFINNENNYKIEDIRDRAEEFSKSEFDKKIKEFLANSFEKGI